MIDLAVTGMVEKFVEIRPPRIRLAGPAGTPLAAEVEIIPRKEYPFTIEDIKVKDGNFIKFAFTRRCIDGHDRCVIRVENIRAEKGRYIDVLFIKTDSPLSPQIPIYVTGIIQ